MAFKSQLPICEYGGFDNVSNSWILVQLTGSLLPTTGCGYYSRPSEITFFPLWHLEKPAGGFNLWAGWCSCHCVPVDQIWPLESPYFETTAPDHYNIITVM